MMHRLSAVRRGGLAQIILTLAVIFGAGITGAAAQTVESIQLSPSEETVTGDMTVPFTVFALDEQGNHTDVTTDATFSENDPYGSVSSNVYFPGKVGTWTVRAIYRGFSADAEITVTEGPLAHIVVNPDTKPEVVRIGNARTFTAAGFDEDNNPVTGITPVWAIQGDAGTISDDGVFTAVKDGDATITATVGAVSTAVRVTVVTIPDESPATNANSNTNAAATTNTSVNNNTNQSGSILGDETETNANVNAGDEAVTTNENTNTATEETETVTEDCTTYAWWVWLLGIVIYLVILGAYYYSVRRRTDMMVWVAPVVLTGLALWAFFALTCSGHFLWVPWVTVIGGLLVTLFRPREFHPTEGREL